MKVFMGLLALTLLAGGADGRRGDGRRPTAGPTAVNAPGADEGRACPCQPACYVIKRMPYPEKRGRGRGMGESRILLLDTCPELRGKAARPTLGVTVDGKTEYREFDVLKELPDEEVAREYAARHCITDVSLR